MKPCTEGAKRDLREIQQFTVVMTRTFSFSWTLSSARWAWRNISARRVLRCRMSFSVIPGQQYFISCQKLPCSINRKASMGPESAHIVKNYRPRKTYLILTHNKLDNVVEKTLSSKQWQFGLMVDDQVQITLKQSMTLLVRHGHNWHWGYGYPS
jgi:hypothetical protein